MYRERTRGCSACGGPMAKRALEVAGTPAMVDVCGECGCVFLEFADGEPGGLARALLADGSGGGPVIVPDGAACPDCAAPYELLNYLAEGPPLWRCADCLGVFATPGQLVALGAYRDQAPDGQPGVLAALFELLARLAP